MLEISLFLSLHPTELNKKLQQIGFKQSKDSMCLLFDDKELSIRALRGQNHFEKSYGYRIHSDLSKNVLIYVLDMILGCHDVLVSGVTKTVQSAHMTVSRIKRLEISSTNVMNVFKKGEITIMYQPPLNRVYFQQRSVKYYSLSQLYQCIKEMECLYTRCLESTQDSLAYEAVIS